MWGKDGGRVRNRSVKFYGLNFLYNIFVQASKKQLPESPNTFFFYINNLLFRAQVGLLHIPF